MKIATYNLEEEKDFEKDEPRDLSICQFSLTRPHQPLVIENLLDDLSSMKALTPNISAT